MKFHITNHLSKFPHSAVVRKDGRVYLFWMVGNQYKRINGYHGEYPPSYMKRVLSLFPAVQEEKILHLFAGTVKGPGVTFDCNPDLFPDVCGNAEEVDNYFTEDSFELVMADPPYTTKDAEIYGTKMPRSHLVFQRLVKVVQKGGMVVWLSTKPPMYRKEQWRLTGFAAFHCGTNRVLRAVTFLEKL
jgi:hypothetical protein